jgi:hypothetical protein
VGQKVLGGKVEMRGGGRGMEMSLKEAAEAGDLI